MPHNSQAKTAPPHPPNQKPLVKSAQPDLVNRSTGGLLTVQSAGWTLGDLPGALYKTKRAVHICTAPMAESNPAVKAKSELRRGPVIVKGPYSK